MVRQEARAALTAPPCILRSAPRCHLRRAIELLITALLACRALRDGGLCASQCPLHRVRTAQDGALTLPAVFATQSTRCGPVGDVAPVEGLAAGLAMHIRAACRLRPWLRSGHLNRDALWRLGSRFGLGDRLDSFLLARHCLAVLFFAHIWRR